MQDSTFHFTHGMVGKRIGHSICLYEFDDVRYGYAIFQNGLGVDMKAMDW